MHGGKEFAFGFGEVKNKRVGSKERMMGRNKCVCLLRNNKFIFLDIGFQLNINRLLFFSEFGQCFEHGGGNRGSFRKISHGERKIRQGMKGNLPVPAIIEKIKSIHNNDVTDSQNWEDDNLIRYVSKLNLAAKSENSSNYQQYHNLGTHQDTRDDEIDASNIDAFHSLTPAKI